MLRFLLLLFFSLTTQAHEGPPYPILVDQRTSFGSFSVWADPDVGVGTFTILVSPNKSAFKHQDLKIEVSSTSLVKSGFNELELAKHAPLIEQDDGKIIFVGEIPFDHEGWWKTGFAIEAGGHRDYVELDVEVTPPGPTRIEFWIALVPFLLMGSLWTAVFFKRRSLRKAS